MNANNKKLLSGNSLAKIVMVSPVTFWMVLLIAIPLLYIFVVSFCSTDESHNIVFSLTLDNYGKLLSPTLLTIYANSLIVAFLSTVACIAVGYPFAYIMAFTSQFRKTLMMIFLMLPFWTNSLIRLYGWRTLLGSEGYVNNLLMALGLTGAPVEFMYTRGAVIFGMVYTLLPFMVLPIHTVIDKLDRSLLEAASDLGAKAVPRFLHITLPLTSPGIFSGFIMVFIPSLGYFFVADIMGGSKSQLIGNVIERQFKEAFNWPFGAVLSIILILITLLLVKLYTKAGGNVDDLGVM